MRIARDPVPAVVGGGLLPAFAGALLGSIAIWPSRLDAPGAFLGIRSPATGVDRVQPFELSGWIDDIFYGASWGGAVAATRLFAQRRVT